MAFTFGAAKGPVFTRWTMEIKGLEGQRSQSTLSHKHSQCLGECTENVYWHQKTCSLVEIPGLVMSTMLWAASSAASFGNGKKTRRKDSLTQTGPLSVWTNRRKTTASQDCYNRRKDVLCYRVVSVSFSYRTFLQYFRQMFCLWTPTLCPGSRGGEGPHWKGCLHHLRPHWYRPEECPCLALLL